MELISRDEVMRLAESGKLLSGSFGERAKDIINSLPTIEERKEGHWIKLGKCEYKCPICGKKIFADDVNERNYCPSCGMKAK